MSRTATPRSRSVTSRADVEWQRRDLLYPNPWNPNRMNAIARAKLHESMDEFGFIDPILVRPHPQVAGGYQIIGGQHRWEIAGERGLVEVPVIVVPVTDDQAKRLTLIDNELHGQADPTRVADLLKDLMDGSSVEEMLRGIPFDLPTVKGFLGFDPLPPLPPPPSEPSPPAGSSIPAGGGGAERWVERTYRLPVSIAEVLDQALARAKASLSRTATDHEALEVLAAEYLAS